MRLMELDASCQLKKAQELPETLLEFYICVIVMASWSPVSDEN
jgi:hypothetical protein